ncbi:MBL fold metallo-hydrolase [Bosea eneae]|uniref:MBL fold metallo-hydrolase n=1 Tax=Bosea eneae TaxID=151454 RepID=A0ABW0ITM5_9HYPH
MHAPDPHGLIFPFPEPPAPGQLIEVAPGIFWARIALPFRLDHVNIYLIEDGDGVAVIDTGIGDEATKQAWLALMAGPLAGKRLTRLFVTHFHPDHIGLAGWLCERFGTPLLTSQTGYLGCLNISLSPGASEAPVYKDFYLRHGLSAEVTQVVSTLGHGYLRQVTPLPPTFTRVVAGDVLRIGGRDFFVLAGDGHAPEQLMFHCPEANVFLAADQILAKITPNISVWAVDAEGNPLGLYLRSLKALPQAIPPGTLVLPGHQLPFYGLAERCAALAAHHAERCRLIAGAVATGPHSVAELVPVMFTRPLDPHQLSFAFSEVFAHVNAMLRLGELRWAEPQGGIMKVMAAG